MSKIIVFISGSGTNLQAIIDCCESKVLNAKVSLVVSNKENAYGNIRANKHNIPVVVKKYRKKDYEKREDYDYELAQIVNEHDYDLIVLAGWMHILSNRFLKNINSPIINLHPALPGEFPGKDAIEQAWEAYQVGKISRTGLMVHHVVEEVDAGAVIKTHQVSITNGDTFESLKERISYYEKPTLISSIENILYTTNVNGRRPDYIGKVRNVYDNGDDTLSFEHTDNQSAFDRHICTIPGKGVLLTKLSEFWFDKTKHIVPNHFLYSNKNIMVGKKCKPYKVEVVVRAYITGSTSTSLWTHYNRGERIYCGIAFPDGLQKNQKLERVVVTPTTKGDKDVPFWEGEMANRGIMTYFEWEYIKEKALELFRFGQLYAASKGLILVDTKYEFGKDTEGNILLIDEIHTCDSSRYWLKSTYQERFDQGLEPDRFDKDVIRTWIRERCDPYKEDLPDIPRELVDNAKKAYTDFYEMLIN